MTDTVTLTNELVPSSLSGTGFGESISVYGDYMAISSATLDNGAVYIFKLVNDAWTQQTINYTDTGRTSGGTTLTPSGGTTGLTFGQSVSLYGDLLVVGAQNSNEVYVFSKNSSDAWTQHTTIDPNSTGSTIVKFGRIVTLYNNYLAVSSQSGGGVQIFKKNTNDNDFTHQQTISAIVSGGNFGNAVKLYDDMLVIADKDAESTGFTNNGIVYVFRKGLNSESWSQEYMSGNVPLTAQAPEAAANNDRFGMGLDAFGDYIVVGAHLEDEPQSGGIVYVFKKESGVWEQKTVVESSDLAEGDWFGFRVAIHDEYLLVSAAKKKNSDNEIDEINGASYIFKKNSDETWSEQKKLVHENAVSGDRHHRVFLNGDYAVVANLNETVNSVNNAGAVYYYDMSNLESSSSGTSENPICYLGNTLIRTDQYPAITASELHHLCSYSRRRIPSLKPITIDGQEIIAVTKFLNDTTLMYRVPSGFFGPGVPSSDTYVTGQHKICVQQGNGQDTANVDSYSRMTMKKAKYFPGLTLVNRGKKDIIYNILLRTHHRVYINNMLTETLHPNDACVKDILRELHASSGC